MSKKYKDVPSSLFCGESGGARKRSYPVNTPSRARAALAYAHNAPNPQGIRDCVYKISKQKGWLDEKGKIHIHSLKNTPKKKSTPKKKIPKKSTLKKSTVKKSTPKKKISKKSTPKKKISKKSTPKKKSIPRKNIIYKKETFVVKESPSKKNLYIIQKVK